MAVSHTLLRLWTREDYLKMAEAGVFAPGERVELIEGEIIKMTPQKGPHMTGVTLVSEELRRAFGKGYVVRVQGPLDLEPLSEPEPDLAVVSGSARDYRDAHPTTAVGRDVADLRDFLLRLLAVLVEAVPAAPQSAGPARSSRPRLVTAPAARSAPSRWQSCCCLCPLRHAGLRVPRRPAEADRRGRPRRC